MEHTWSLPTFNGVAYQVIIPMYFDVGIIKLYKEFS